MLNAYLRIVSELNITIVILFNMDFSVILYTGTVTYMGSICLNIHLIMSTIYSRCKTTLLYLTLKQSLDMHLALMGYVIIKTNATHICYCSGIKNDRKVHVK
jgi:hypothetical protein